MAIPGWLRSLKEGDPQTLAVLAASVFLGSVCWFSWNLISGPEPEPLTTPRARTRAAAVPTPPPSMMAMLLEQRENQATGEVQNPFFKAVPTPRARTGGGFGQMPRIRLNLPKGPNRNVAETGGDPFDVPVGQAPQPTPEPTTRRVSLVYQGMLTRPDRATVALLSFPEEGNRQRFMAIGDVWEGYRIMGITPEGIAIQPEKGKLDVIPRGESKSYEVPK